uniref:Protein kinase n=1 Tax=Marseillevirus LCMAC101 TaxID=2506602 RepID=A0A481YTB1_9VIRU|nr:MAG: protein kinase [Marseillevirus LCMAC101]
MESLNVPNSCHKLISRLDFSRVVKYTKQLGYNVTVHTDRKKVYSLILYSVSDMFFVLPSRIINKNIIQKRLEGIELENGEACPGNKKLMKVIDIGQRLGTGTYGSVYSALAKSKTKKGTERPGYLSEFVLKLSAIKTSSYNNLKNGWKKSHPWKIPREARELMVHYLINPLLTENICPNFIFLYHWYLCNKCTHLQIKREKRLISLDPKECIISVLEKVDGGFNQMVLRRSKNWSAGKKDKIYRVAIFQVIMALAVLQKYYAIDHYDAGFRNIFFKEISRLDNSVTYWTYILNGDTYHVPNPGYMFFLADYGLAKSLRMFGQKQPSSMMETRLYNLIGKTEVDHFQRILEEEGDITYYPNPDIPYLATDDRTFDPYYNPEVFHIQDKGLLILTKELEFYLKNGEIQDIQDYLNLVFVNETGKSAEELFNEKSDGPPVNYPEILEGLFGKWKNPPEEGICIGVYDADKPLPFNIDEYFLDILKTKIY